MGQFESLLWDRRARQPRTARGETCALPAIGTRSTLTEWTARPLGRLGRPLVAEIETYLEFFAIANAPERA